MWNRLSRKYDSVGLLCVGYSCGFLILQIKRVKCVECVCAYVSFSVLREGCYLFQISKNALLQEVLMICDPMLSEVAGNPFNDFERWIGPSGINNKTLV